MDWSVSVFLEPIALYHQRDLLDGDGGWLADYAGPDDWAERHVPIGSGRTWPVGSGEPELTFVTFGNGLPMSLRVAGALASSDGVSSRVLDLRWLSPLPVRDILREAAATGRVLVVDETRRTGGVSEAVLAALVDGGF
ncbi:MAG TPA: transketolase C-terminal domain-containing protein, partial [Jatrophihabitans sp.]|nr:transketolase C-terminal domain-containing protein [Jatrophihabitans sp.]